MAGQPTFRTVFSTVTVNSRPRGSLGRVVDDLGATVLDLVHGDPNAAQDVSGVVIHDPVDEWDLPPAALVLGVGLSDPDQIATLLTQLGDRHAAGLVLRAPVPADGPVADASARSGVAVLGLTRGASWVQVAAMLRSLLAVDGVGAAGTESLGGIPSGDLFALANAVAALLDAPITIEDRNSRVLAYSGHQEEADPSRVATILGRQVPERYTRRHTERGVFRRLYGGEEPVWIEPDPTDPADELPRVAVAVRAGDEVLGSMWAVVRHPLSPERTKALCDSAKVAALHLLHVRAGADVERRLRAELVSTALEGGIGARDALARLGLTGTCMVPLALAVLDPGDNGDGGQDAGLATERQRLTDAFAMHLSAVHPRCAAALIGDVAYGLLPVGRDGAGGEERALRIAEEFLRRVGRRGRPVIGIGQVARDVNDLPHARASADRVLRVLRAGSEDRSVAGLADVHGEALMLELRDLVTARGEHATGAVARLLDYDARHNGRLVETLRAWLDAFGDVITASAAVCVHPNTFRYRLRRLTQVGGIDLENAEARFSAMVQLRVLADSDGRDRPA